MEFFLNMKSIFILTFFRFHPKNTHLENEKLLVHHLLPFLKIKDLNLLTEFSLNQ